MWTRKAMPKQPELGLYPKWEWDLNSNVDDEAEMQDIELSPAQQQKAVELLKTGSDFWEYVDESVRGAVRDAIQQAIREAD